MAGVRYSQELNPGNVLFPSVGWWIEGYPFLQPKGQGVEYQAILMTLIYSIFETTLAWRSFTSSNNALVILRQASLGKGKLPHWIVLRVLPSGRRSTFFFCWGNPGSELVMCIIVADRGSWQSIPIRNPISKLFALYQHILMDWPARHYHQLLTTIV